MDDPTNVKLEMVPERRRALHTQRGWYEPKAGITAWLGQSEEKMAIIA